MAGWKRSTLATTAHRTPRTPEPAQPVLPATVAHSYYDTPEAIAARRAVINDTERPLTRLPLHPDAQQLLDQYLATVDPNELTASHRDRQNRYWLALHPEAAAHATAERDQINAAWAAIETNRTTR